MSADPLAPFVPRLLRGHRGGPGCQVVDATLLFADVSGFTRLTEKLARTGKAGVEEMVTTISTVFAALLEDPDAGGGDVLKFGGDALLLLFTGVDHAGRAASTAVAMQRRLREVGGIDTSRGRVRLRMSVGIHSGQFHVLVCGDDHLELHVLGPDASTTTALESAAAAGDILISPATAGRLRGARLLPGPGDALRLRSAVAAPAAPHPSPPPSGDLERFVAPSLRTRLAAGGGDHEHRRATVAFAHFGAVDELLAAGRADEVFDRVQVLTVTVMDALAEYEVLLTATDIAADGGKFMLTAGAPDATGDEDARMLRVAHRIVRADCGLPVRVGVNAGNVFVGTVGPPHRRTFSTMGDATNLAARVQGKAAVGEVLATDAVLAATGARFRTGAPRTLRLKGKARPVQAAPVAGPTPAQAAVAGGSEIFVGREHELGVLEDAWKRAREGHGAVVELVGEEGVGKSRLVSELRHRAVEATWLEVVCEPYERSSPYHAARLLLRDALGVAPAAPPDAVASALADATASRAPSLEPWVPLIADVVGAPVTETAETADIAEQFRRQRTADAALELFTVLADGPLVVAIEDASEMDDASAELVTEILRQAPSRPWLVVVTRRDDDQGLRSSRGYRAEVLPLERLDDTNAAALAARLAERTPVPAHLLTTIVERSEGNPLFLSELVAAQSVGQDDEVPRSVEAVIATRIDALADADRRALRYLSVLGDRFRTELVDAALGPLGIRSDDEELWSRLGAFVHRDGGGVSFRTGLVRHVAYEGLAYERRRELHGRVADGLLAFSTSRSGALALHLTHAGRWDEAWDTAVRAAGRALERGANVVAAELYDLALTAAAQIDGLAPDRLVEVALAGGRAWLRAGIGTRALAAYDRAAAEAPDDRTRLEVLLHRADVHQRGGNLPAALQLYARVATRVSTAGAHHPDISARAHAGYAECRLHQGRYADAVDHAMAAVESAEAADDPGLLATAYHLLDRAHVGLDDPDEATRYRDLALPLYARVGDLPAQGTVLHDLATDAHRTGQLEVALWFYEQSREVRLRAGDVVRAATSINAVGEVLLALDRASEAEERFAEALVTWRGARSARGVAIASRNLGQVALRRGDAPGALLRLEEAAATVERVGATDLLPSIDLLRAEAFLLRGRFVEAWDAATQALSAELPGTANRARAHRCRAEALRGTGGEERAAAEEAVAQELEPPSAAAVRA